MKTVNNTEGVETEKFYAFRFYVFRKYLDNENVMNARSVRLSSWALISHHVVNVEAPSAPSDESNAQRKDFNQSP